MTGMAAWTLASCRCTANPCICGICRSSTTQSGRCASMDFKNSAPESNVSASRPAERNKRAKALRMGSSSSTKAINGRLLVTGANCNHRNNRAVLDLSPVRFGRGATAARAERGCPLTSDLRLPAPDSAAFGQSHQLGNRLDLHFFHHACAMHFDCLLHDAEVIGDLFV
jgi:hypothetical protein